MVSQTPQIDPLVPAYRVRILSDEQLEKFKSNSFLILEETGFLCPTERAWENSGKEDILDDAWEKVDQILKNHKPLPMDDEVQKELDLIYQKAQEQAG